MTNLLYMMIYADAGGQEMKAYKIYDRTDGQYGAVVFAETPGKARAAAAYADGFEDVEFTDIGVRRIKELDSCYRGHTYMSWLDDQDRTDLVKLANFQCHPYDDCEGSSCPAHEYCDRFKEESEYET
jgi:hypothetical protein